MADPREVTPTGRRFGARLRALMDGLGSVETGRPISIDGLYRLIEDEPDLAMSRGHLYRLIDGRAIPRLDLIEALARFFKVPASYFVDDHTYLDETIGKVDTAVDDIDGMVARLTELRVALVRDRDAATRDDNGHGTSNLA